MPLNEQMTSAAYSADILNVHDKDLLWSRAFGTNVTADTGDKFTTNVGAVDINAGIIPRLAMLNVNTFLPDAGAPQEAPRGSTFLFADPNKWLTFPESPILGPGTIAVVLYAHTLLKDQPDAGQTGSGQSFVDLILAPEGLVGEAVPIPLIACGISGTDPVGAEPLALQIDTFNNGGDFGPTDSNTAATWGGNMYWRIFMVTTAPAFKSTSVQVEVSRDGIAWQLVQQTSMDDLVSRIGLGVRCVANGLLDWARLYSWVITDVQQNYIMPRPPETGGRLFTP